MKIRYGFVSNSSSASFIINFDNRIETKDDIALNYEEFEHDYVGKFSTEDIKDVLYTMLKEDYAQSFSKWFHENYDYIRFELYRIAPWYETVDLDKVIDYLNRQYPQQDKTKPWSEIGMLERIREWDNSNTFAFEVGGDGDFCSSYSDYEDPDKATKLRRIGEWMYCNLETMKRLFPRLEAE